MSKPLYAVGDKVYAGEKEAIVAKVFDLSSWPYNGGYGYEYSIIYSDTHLGKATIAERKLTRVPVKQENEYKLDTSQQDKYNKTGGCVCGAWITGFPNHHMFYCHKHGTNVNKTATDGNGD